MFIWGPLVPHLLLAPPCWPPFPCKRCPPPHQEAPRAVRRAMVCFCRCRVAGFPNQFSPLLNGPCLAPSSLFVSTKSGIDSLPPQIPPIIDLPILQPRPPPSLPLNQMIYSPQKTRYLGFKLPLFMPYTPPSFSDQLFQGKIWPHAANPRGL